MAYTATYTDSDIAPATTDALVKVIAVFGTLGTVIGLALFFVIIMLIIRMKR